MKIAGSSVKSFLIRQFFIKSFFLIGAIAIQISIMPHFYQINIRKLSFDENWIKFEEEPPFEDVQLETNSNFDSSCIFTSLPQGW